MFTKLRQFAREFFMHKPEPTVQTATAEQQIQQEHAEAAHQGMVTTRSQEHNTWETGLVERLEIDAPGPQVRKRKGNDGEENTPTQSAVKRRRASPERDPSVDAGPGVSNGSLKVEARNQTSDEADRFLDDIGNSISSIMSLPDHHVPESQTLIGDSQIPDIVNESQGIKADGGPSGNGESSGNNAVQKRSNTSRKRRKHNPTHSRTNGDLHKAISSPNSTNSPKEDKPKVKKPIHKRFGSEEPSLSSDQRMLEDAQIRSLDRAMEGAVVSDEENDSGADVPEVVTASAGLNQARSAAAEALKAAESQALAKKEKRQKRDAHLREQAVTAKKQRKSHAKESPGLDEDAQLPTGKPDTDSVDQDTRAKRQPGKTVKRNGPLPALLPDDILAAEPVMRLPTPPPTITTITSKKRRFIDADPKPLKDIKRGPVRVRILEDSKSVLPPRASKASRSLKESWLAGQRGRKDVVSQRRKPGGGFLRT